MANVDQIFGSIGVGEIVFNTTPGKKRTETVSGMMFVSGANLMINIAGSMKTVTVS